MLIIKKIKLVFLALILLLASLGVYTIKNFFDNKAHGKGEVIEDDYYAAISNEVFKEVQEISFKSGYKRSYNFSFPVSEVKNFAFEDVKDKNWFQSVINGADKKLRKKELSFDVGSIVMLGYDTKELKQEDISYNLHKKTLEITPPNLQMVIMSEYANIKTDEGVLTSLFDSFTLEEMDVFQNKALEKVKEKFLVQEEIALGYELTNKSLEAELLSNELSIDIQKVVFKENNEPVEIVNEEIEINQ